MLTILFKLLSILGILLLILLGLALAVLLLILLFPISYRLSGKKNTEELLLSARIKWLFGFLRMTYDYPVPGKLLVKLLCFTIYDSSMVKPEGSEKSKESKKPEQPGEKKTAGETGTSQARSGSTETLARKEAAPQESALIQTQDTASAETEESERGQGPAQTQEPESSDEAGGRMRRIYRFFTKIRYTVQKICDKIKHILENISFYKELWNDPDTQGLMKHAGKRLGYLWKRLRPGKLELNAFVGTGSPDTTGYLYGLYGMLLPKLGKGICITPDFEQAIFEGDFKASGHFMTASVLFHSLRLLMDRRLRQLLSKIRQYQKAQKK